MHGLTTPRRGKSFLGFFCSRLILPAVRIKLLCFFICCGNRKFHGHCYRLALTSARFRSEATPRSIGQARFHFRPSRCVASQRRGFVSAVCVYFLNFPLVWSESVAADTYLAAMVSFIDSHYIADN